MADDTPSALHGNERVPSESRGRWLSAVVAFLVAGVGAAAIVGSKGLGYWTPLGPGPGFFPMWLGILLLVLGSVWLVQTSASMRRRDAHPAPDSDQRDVHTTATGVVPDQEMPPEYSLPTVVAIVVSLCVLAAALETVGYQLSMLVFLLFHLVVLGRRRLLLSLALALAGSFGVFFVFTRLLTVPLPASSIPVLRDMGL